MLRSYAWSPQCHTTSSRSVVGRVVLIATLLLSHASGPRLARRLRGGAHVADCVMRWLGVDAVGAALNILLNLGARRILGCGPVFRVKYGCLGLPLSKAYSHLKCRVGERAVAEHRACSAVPLLGARQGPRRPHAEFFRDGALHGELLRRKPARAALCEGSTSARTRKARAGARDVVGGVSHLDRLALGAAEDGVLVALCAVRILADLPRGCGACPREAPTWGPRMQRSVHAAERADMCDARRVASSLE